MRILGKGLSAKGIKAIYPNAVMYDDNDKTLFDTSSDELTIPSPGFAPNNFLITNSKNLKSEYDLLLPKNKFSIWISGTNGKSSTTLMLGKLLENNNSVVGGNIGVALGLMDISKKIWILETSSFALHYNKTSKPNIYILLNVTPDHLNWHGSYKKYETTKLSPIFKMEKGKQNIAFLPKKLKKSIKLENKKISVKIIFYKNTKNLAKQFNINLKKITLKEPFKLNATLALCVSIFLGNKANYKKINAFTPQAYTMEHIKDGKNRLWINDSKATNKDATLAGLYGLINKSNNDLKIYLILGGDDKNIDLSSLFIKLKKYNLEIFIIGKDTSKLCFLAKKNNLIYHNSLALKKAVKHISLAMKDNEICLFSPACASFDQFHSYKHRGEYFTNLVKQL